MYFTKQELYESINKNDSKIKNYLETFGFIIIKDMLPKNEFVNIKKEFNKQFEERLGEVSIQKMILNRLFEKNKKYGFKDIYSKFKRASGLLFIGNFLDNSNYYTNIFFSENFQKIYKYLASQNWIYFGSDGQKYIRAGYSWHRDWNTKAPVYKMFFKMSNIPQLGGDFKIIPGAHGVNDMYSKLISDSMMWPLPAVNFLDGMSEKNHLVKIKNPRRYFDKYSTHLKDVPHVRIKLKKGDALIFNTSLPHNLSEGFPNINIDMMSFLFAPNPFDNLKNDTPIDDLNYLIDLMVNERNFCNVEPYGNSLMKHTFFKKNNHFIEFISNNNINSKCKYIGGKLFFNNKIHQREIPFKFYEKLGKLYKSNININMIHSFF